MYIELGEVNWMNFYRNNYYKLPGQLLQACLHNSTTQVVKSEPLNSFEEEITASVNKSLAVEIVELKEKVAADEYQLTLKEKKIEVKLHSRNITKRIKRKEEKISKLLSLIKSLKREAKAPTKMKHTKSLSNLVRYYKAKCGYLNNKLKTFECTECNELDITVNKLKEEKKELLERNAILMAEVKEPNKISFYSGGKYDDKLRRHS